MTDFDLTTTGMDRLLTMLNAMGTAMQRVADQRVVVGTNVRYARYVHDGTRPHDIAPRSKKALFWKGAKHPVTRVHHPGYKGNPFLTDALAAQRGAVAVRLRQGVQKVVESGDADAMRQALMAAGLLVQADAQRRANVKTGNLRRSIHTEIL